MPNSSPFVSRRDSQRPYQQEYLRAQAYQGLSQEMNAIGNQMNQSIYSSNNSNIFKRKSSRHNNNSNINVIDQNNIALIGSVSGASQGSYRTNPMNTLPLKPLPSQNNYKNMRTIDRAAILEEIQQNKIDEIRTNLSNAKTFSRKYSNFQKH